VVGGDLIDFLVGITGVDALDTLWAWLRIPISATGLYLFLLAFYRWGPPEPLPKSWLAALVGTAGALAASLVFGLYLGLAPSLGATFGVLGAVAAALVWLYLGAFAILLGGVVVSYTMRWRSDRVNAAA
jgi:membrane protein